jgi:glycosyltransferase involved in cell wall biosynthesis
MLRDKSSSKTISTIRVGVPLLGDKSWPAGINYVESLVKAVTSLLRDERPQMFLVVHDLYLHAIDLYKSLFPLLEGLVFVGNNPDLTKGKLLNKVLHCYSDLELNSVIDFYYPVNSNVLPGVCSASWIPDFQHIHLPELFANWELQSRDDRYQKIAELAKLVVFSSKDAEKDFRKLFPNSNAVTRVLSFYSQIPDECFTIDPVLIQKEYDLPDDFFICPNHFWIHKNHMRLFEALASLHQTGKKVHLVCTGPLSDHRAPEYISQLQRLILDLGIKDYVHILGVIPRMEQIQLLRRALAVIQPSLFEGWSTVVEDARILGKTIILSDLAVHHEQAPRHGKYFDRQSTEALINALEEILPDLKPGPDRIREKEAMQEQKLLITEFAHTFCEIVLEGMQLFHEPATNQDIDPIPNNEIDVSIIVATKNRAHLLDEMLISLKKASEGVRYEVIVIEGNSTDNTQEILQKHGVDQIYSEKEHFGEGKHSWAQLYNFGFSKARGKWGMYASDDIVFHESCIIRAIEILSQQSPEVAGGIFFYRNIAAEPSWKDFGIDFTYGQKLLMNYGLIRLDNFREVKGIDEHYNFYCADGDLCYKLYEKGKEFIPLIGCFVSHVNIYDSTRQINYSKADEDIQDYKKRWKHFVTTDVEPDPRRLMWDEVVELFKKEQEKRQIDTIGISSHIRETRHSQTSSLDQLKEKGLWSEGNPLRLHLGCGEQHLEGYINIDYPLSEHTVQTKNAADIFADITTLSFPEQSVDEIQLHHVFEHFDRATALALLIRWHQWLKIGGKLYIETPDLMGSAKTLLENSSWSVKMGVVRHLAGSHEAKWAYHIDQWFPERFEHTLRKLGFHPVETHSVSWQQEPYLSNVHVIACKAKDLNIEELIKAAEELLKESMVSEHEKLLYEVWCKELHAFLDDIKCSQKDKELLLEKLQEDFRNVQALICLAEIEICRSNLKKAENYLIAAMALEPKNTAAKTLWEKLQN